MQGQSCLWFMCVSVRENGGKRAGTRPHAADVVACFSLPAIFHPVVFYICSFPPSVSPTTSTKAGVHILFFIDAGRGLKKTEAEQFSGHFSYQYALRHTVFVTRTNAWLIPNSQITLVLTLDTKAGVLWFHRSGVLGVSLTCDLLSA